MDSLSSGPQGISSPSLNDPRATLSAPKADPYLTDDFYPLKLANESILAALRADESSPDADLYKRLASTSTQTLSASSGDGMLLYSYLGGEHESSNNTMNGIHEATSSSTPMSLTELNHKLTYSRSTPLPPYLINLMKDTKLSCLMGILPLGNMVWVSIDDALYLWQYGSGDGTGRNKEDFVCFKVPSGQCVVSVGLVKPKAGVFTNAVEWCLVVTTPEEAILCALARESASSSLTSPPLRLIPTRYVIPTDSVPILSICGSDDGRIFLGGYDGCLYEMVYEGFNSKNYTNPQNRSGYWFDDESAYYDNESKSSSLVGAIASGSKRTISNLIFGPTVSTSEEHRPRKCRKVNHSSVGSSIITSIIPGFVLRATSFMFGTKSPTEAGPIINLTLDSDRNTLYGLTSKGYIHAFDLTSTDNSKQQQSHRTTDTQPRLACTINVTKSVRRYLDCVAHGRMYPPSHLGTESTVSAINFPGGSGAAQAGVGGMNGARQVLKLADTEMERNKTKPRSKGGRASTSGQLQCCLHPVSIHVVKSSESKSLTLLVVSSGGLRYYLSTLVDTSSFSFSRKNLQLADRFTLSYIHIPPSYSLSSNNKIVIGNQLSGTSTRIQQPSNVDSCTVKGFYEDGVTMLAIEAKQRGNDNLSGVHALVSITHSCTQKRFSEEKSSNLAAMSSVSTDFGEIVSLPMVSGKFGGNESSPLVGGRVWDIASTSRDADESSTAVCRLFIHSSTPTDSELQSDLIPPYYPPARLRDKHKKKENENGSLPSVSSVDTASRSTDLTTNFPTNIISFTFNLLGRVLFPYSSNNRFIPSSSQGNWQSLDIPIYTISENVGCSRNGFIMFQRSRALPSINRNGLSPSYDRSKRRATATMLPSWLVSPNIVPISEVASQHVLSFRRNTPNILALNSSGLFHFNLKCPIEQMQYALANASIGNMGMDVNVRSLFSKYGYIESCAMCLSIGISDHSDEIARKAVRAAMAFANRPVMVPASSHDVFGKVLAIPPRNDLDGYVFQPSSLHNGLVLLISRLLRPIWYKPALVVTESKILSSSRRGNPVKILPAKVEFLLDEVTLNDIRRPLASLQTLMREVFAPAIKMVPGSKDHSHDLMDLDDRDMMNGSVGGDDYMTKAISYQSQMTAKNTRQHPPSEKDLDTVAFLNEERNIHSLYRLVSRTIQLLTLLSHFRRAHSTPQLPEVEFGLLHGLSFSQLVTIKSAQDRIEAIFTALICSSDDEFDRVSEQGTKESSNLSSLLSSQCYLYFSIGSRLTYLGFQSAQSALSQSTSSIMRSQHISNASRYFRLACRHWYSPSLITGNSLQGHDGTMGKVVNGESSSSAAIEFDQLASHALECGSPLAKAASVLIDLDDVGGVVDICLICANNFGGNYVIDEVEGSTTNDTNYYQLNWEKGLYHKPLVNRKIGDKIGVIDNDASTGNSRAIIVKDENSKATDLFARRTCYGVLFFHLNLLIVSSSQRTERKSLVEKMVSYAITCTDKLFLKSFYEYLATSGNIDTLLRIDNIYLEKWLEEYDDKLVLLWRYYLVHGFDWKAAEIMRIRGCTEEKVHIDERIECLTRAINSFSSAINGTSNQSLGLSDRNMPTRQEIGLSMEQISETLDIAVLQSRILSTILKSDNYNKSIDPTKLSMLKDSLLNVSVNSKNAKNRVVHIFDVLGMLFYVNFALRATSNYRFL